MSKLSELLGTCIRDADTLGKRAGISEEELSVIREVAVRYPMCVTPYYLSLIDWSDPDDPIRKLSIPSAAEYSGEGTEDTSGEQSNTVSTGMQHKYSETLLVLTTNQCSMYCRHCFRKRMVGYTSEEINGQIEQVRSYVTEHAEVRNVLLSGGDFLVNENEIIRQYLDNLADIQTLDYIRLGTRTPVVLPERIYGDPELLEILSAYNRKKQLIVVTHYDHPREMTEESKRAVRALISAGIIVRNQTVLLKGVNDDPDVLAELMNGLISFGVTPYYLFQCRPARGVVTLFQVPIARGVEIAEAAKAKCSGQAKCFRYAMSHVTGKIEIIGPIGDEMVFRYHQAKDRRNLGRVFKMKLTPDQCWLEDIPE